MEPRRLVLVDPNRETREVFAHRLRAQGLLVEEASDGVVGAEIALASPPSVVVSDLWMPGVSGVQLCRLLGAEPATARVPVVLRAENDDARSRFWARRAGARSLVPKGRMGELVRVLGDLLKDAPPEDGFVFRLPGSAEMRDRIAQHLDRALFETVVTAEVRALATASSFPRLFDALAQLVGQLVDYRWLAFTTDAYFAVHAHRRHATTSEGEARAVLDPSADASFVRIVDDDPVEERETSRVLVHDCLLGGVSVGRLALGLAPEASHADDVVPVVVRELGSVVRLVLLLEESQRLATTDPLTGLFNRRAFVTSLEREIARAERHPSPISLLVLDLDHFKSVNDSYGHGIGDVVLAALGAELRRRSRASDLLGRWGGEEFLLALPSTNEAGALTMAERIRESVTRLEVADARGETIPLTVSIGVAERVAGETVDALVDRADRAMYEAKLAGRNRVVRAPSPEPTAARCVA